MDSSLPSTDLSDWIPSGSSATAVTRRAQSHRQTGRCFHPSEFLTSKERRSASKQIGGVAAIMEKAKISRPQDDLFAQSKETRCSRRNLFSLPFLTVSFPLPLQFHFTFQSVQDPDANPREGKACGPPAAYSQMPPVL